MYANSGVKQKWDLYVYKIGSTIKTLTKKDTIALTEKGEMNKYKLIDKKSSTSNDIYSKTSISSSLKKNLEKLEKQKSFFDFYQYRCPSSKGAIHEFSNNKCSYCGILENDLRKGSDSYFKKYESQYESDLDNNSKLIIIPKGKIYKFQQVKETSWLVK